MISIAVCVIVFFVILAVVSKASGDWDRVSNLLLAALCAAIALIIICRGMLSIEGLMPGYSTGEREGYLTKVSVKGFFFKTNEAQIQVGTGNMAALQEPFAFSIPDEKLAIEANNLLGKRVRIRYSQWFVMPMTMGETPYECVEIEPLGRATDE
jgi:hypothetical protein